MGVYTENQWNAHELSVKFYFTVYINDIFTDLLLESISIITFCKLNPLMPEI